MHLPLSSATAAEPARAAAAQSSRLAHSTSDGRDGRDYSVDRSRSRSRSRSLRISPAEDEAGSSLPSPRSPAVHETAARLLKRATQASRAAVVSPYPI